LYNTIFWSVVELKRYDLGVTIANTWVRLNSYTKDDTSQSLLDLPKASDSFII